MGHLQPWPFYGSRRWSLPPNFNRRVDILIQSPLPRKADIQFRDYPFTKLRKVYLEPSYLENTRDDIINNSASNETTFEFTFSNNDAHVITFNRSRSIRIGETHRYKVQVHLRFTVEGGDPPAGGVYDDFLPPGLRIYCNTREVDLFPARRRPRPRREGRRPPARPLNIAPYLILSSHGTNLVRITWGDVPQGRKVVMSIDLVDVISPRTLVAKLTTLSKPKISVDEMISRIKNRFREFNAGFGDDEKYSATIIVVPLDCPLRKRHMKFPAIGKNCNHIQCFDAETFLRVNRVQPTWRCPICLNSLYYNDILHNEYFQNVVNVDPLCPKGIEVQLFRDGTWKRY